MPPVLQIIQPSVEIPADSKRPPGSMEFDYLRLVLRVY